MDTDIDETKQKPTESSNDVSESPIEVEWMLPSYEHIDLAS